MIDSANILSVSRFFVIMHLLHACPNYELAHGNNAHVSLSLVRIAVKLNYVAFTKAGIIMLFASCFSPGWVGWAQQYTYSFITRLFDRYMCYSALSPSQINILPWRPLCCYFPVISFSPFHHLFHEVYSRKCLTGCINISCAKSKFELRKDIEFSVRSSFSLC